MKKKSFSIKIPSWLFYTSIVIIGYFNFTLALIIFLCLTLGTMILEHVAVLFSLWAINKSYPKLSINEENYDSFVLTRDYIKKLRERKWKYPWFGRYNNGANFGFYYKTSSYLKYHITYKDLETLYYCNRAIGTYEKVDEAMDFLTD